MALTVGQKVYFSEKTIRRVIKLHVNINNIYMESEYAKNFINQY